ncbi:MAG: thiamine phosphate synthase [Alphaproteobacteria bacterium]|nr:thiamine phosphate synthase [Alphaproteobacteria bacterium]
MFSSIISFERPYDKDGAPACGIYLVMPREFQIGQFLIQAVAAFKAMSNSRYQKQMHALELRFPEEIYDKERDEATQIVAMCRRNGIVPIVRDDVGLCVECGADGVMLSSHAGVAQARAALGDDAIIGVDCDNSRQIAEMALEAGVDFVQFSEFFAGDNVSGAAELSLLEWWATRTHLPAVARGTLDVEKCIAMAHAGAGFIGAGSWVWEHDEGPARAIYWLQESIEHGLSKQRVN